jgi:hypothetical protein
LANWPPEMEPKKPWVTPAIFPPRFDLREFPEGERDSVEHIQGLLGRLFGYVNSFDAAIRLAQRSAQEMSQLRDQNPDGGYRMPEPLHEYQFVAARDGAMTIYHFACVIDGIRQSRRNAPTLSAMIDDQRIKIAGRLFNTYFPDFERVRHAVAHAAELMATPESTARNISAQNTITSHGHELSIGDLLDEQNGKFTTTIEGCRVSYQLSRDALNKLVRIQGYIYSAFERVKVETA